VRALNEDSILALPPLYAVADGLGGHQSGEVASSIAVDTLRDTAPRFPDAGALARAVQSANQAVITAAEKGVGRSGMGTTMTAVMVENGRAVAAQVGDSRAYLLRNRALTQITDDHSVVGAMVRSGHLSLEEARQHPQRSVITRALGSDPNLNVDTFEISVLRGDRLLLCSDGLTSMLDDAHIAEILMAALDPNQAAEQLIAAALGAGGADNISVIVVDITEEQGAGTLANAGANKKRSKLWLWALLWLALVVGVLAAVVYFTKDYVEHQAYLSVNSSNGLVYLNRGAPGKILGFRLTFESQATTVQAQELAPEAQAKLKLPPTYESLEAARADLDEMVATSPVLQKSDQIPPPAPAPAPTPAPAPAPPESPPAQTPSPQERP
jgi:protein phosphatase